MEFFNISQNSPAILADFTRKVGAQVPDQWCDQVQNLLIEGFTVMYSPRISMIELHDRHYGDPIKMIYEGVVQIVESLREESGDTLPVVVMLYVSQLLVCEWLDFLEKTGTINITTTLLEQIAHQSPGLSSLKQKNKTANLYHRPPYLH
ncbi:hypothetical protein [Glaciimonas sp. PAMC28666]|uniref:hypothetical protein n=1 Tax=Glaciimonas sp. PAMC28666 TaxID=2807626 RepID=UPI00196518DD|nr:hypothetical protein [Glaciimonas sp. PAMC28666]QRX83259.1 hypothetical protein JQN73_02990 [Glaciimonas sp. PAMC28666]